MELKSIEKVVTTCLIKNEETRKSDFTLYIQTLKELGFDTECIEKFFRAHGYNLPSFAAVTRARRKVQSAFPELKDKHVSKYRKEIKEPEYKQYSRTKISKEK